MAAVTPPADAAELLKNLSLNSQAKTLEPAKKSSLGIGNGQVQPSSFMDPAMAYFPNGYPSAPYYYGGYNGITDDWVDYSRYVNASGVDLAHGLYGYGYAPYGSYSQAGSPVPTVGYEGQLYGAQNYQYTSPYFQQVTPTSGPYPAAVTYSKGETTTPAPAVQPSLTSSTTNGVFYGVGNGAGLKGNTGPTSYQNLAFNVNNSYGRDSQNGYQDVRYSYDGVYSPIPWFDGSLHYDSQTRNNGVASRTQNHLMTPRPLSDMNTSTGCKDQMYRNKLYGGQHGNTCQSGYGYGTKAYDLQSNSCGWSTVDNKFKLRGRANGFSGYTNENSDSLNELNRGPRTITIKNQKPITPIAIAVKGQHTTLSPTDSIENKPKDVEEFNIVPDREQYNKTEFPETYADAKFFIIKSYSEDDVHKSIKYNVWSSTQNGNKKLDAAYREAQQKSGSCPVFLFFSVNTSGQFVGVAEMMGPVDFNKSLEYWQQDKWVGCFPVKWHVVKDISNSLLRHIVLENNENKPVTNSRDTQEVKLEHGLQMIKIFKEHSTKQCVLDDFQFYEDRQKKIQEIKANQQLFQKHAWERKPAIDEKLKEGIEVEIVKSDSVSVEDTVAKPAEKVLLNGVAKGLI